MKEVSLGSTKKRTIRFKESETNASSSLSSLSMKQRRGDLSIPTESVAIEEYTEYENSGSSFLTSTLAWFHDLLEKYTRGDDWFSQGLVMLVSFIVLGREALRRKRERCDFDRNGVLDHSDYQC